MVSQGSEKQATPSTSFRETEVGLAPEVATGTSVQSCCMPCWWCRENEEAEEADEAGKGIEAS